ncbi:MAG: Ig-like domain-containing protein [Methanobacterium sp.]|nr:Ig-like domain-containing protein [Methanobacterium sp.]
MNNKRILVLFLMLTVAILAAGAVSAADNTTGNSTTDIVTTTYNSSSSPPPDTFADPVISGTVLDENGQPVNNAVITVYDLSDIVITTGSTDSAGYYSVSFFSGDTVFKVKASYPGYVSPINEVTVYWNPWDGIYYGNTNFQLGKYAYVNGDTGSDSYDGTSPTYLGGFTGPKPTIQGAINVADDGCTVQVMGGSYTENLTISNRIILEPYGFDSVNIYPANYVIPTISVYTGSQIHGLTIEGTLDSAIRLYFSNGSHIYNNYIYNGNNGIFLDQSNGNVIDNNIIDYSYNGISIADSNGNLIQNNTIEYSNQGIVATFTNYNTIKGNYITNSDTGIFILSSNNISILSNNITNNSCGIYLAGVNTVTISYNRFYMNEYYEDGYLILNAIDNEGDNEGNTYADNNWWGTNDGPSGMINGTGIVYVDRYLMLNAYSDSYSIPTDGSTTIYGYLTYNNYGEDTSISGFYVPITPGSFSTTSGYLIPIDVDYYYGWGSSTLYADSSPNYSSVDVQVDDATVTIYDIEYYDGTPPSVEITTPTDGSYVENNVNIDAYAYDDFGINYVDFYIDYVYYSTDWDGTDGWSYDWDSTIDVDGYHTITATAYDMSGNWSEHSIQVIIDNNDPTIDITNPVDGNYVNGIVDISTNPYDDAGVNYVEFYIDGVYYDSDWSGFDGWTYSWDTTGLPSGPYTITATAYDNLGHSSTDSINVYVDNTGPMVDITNPTNNAFLNGNVPVDVNASDFESGMDYVEFYMNSVLLYTDSYGGDGWNFNWDTSSINGNYTITVVAYDILGNSSSDSIDAHIDNIGPSVSINSPVDGSLVNGNVNIDAYAFDGDNTWSIGVDYVEFSTSSGYSYIDNNGADGWSCIWDASGLNGPYTITATAYDYLGNNSSYTMTLYTDSTSPTVVVWYPGDGATVSGNIDILVNASDFESGMNYVEFYVDSVLIGTDSDGPDFAGNWSCNWDTTILLDGSYTITAVAYDMVGYYVTDNITVTVDNTGPTVVITDPSDGSSVSGVVNIIATASDVSGVSHVQFSTPSGEYTDSDGTDGWSCSWNTLGLIDGSYSITATAYDTLGNSANYTINLDVDNTNPVVDITNPAYGTTVNGSVPITANASDASGVAYVEFYYNNGSNVLIYTDNNGLDGWSCNWDTTSLSDGLYGIVAYAYDVAGNSTSDYTYVILVNTAPDTTPPIVNINPASGTYTYAINVTLTSEPDATIQYSLNGGAWTNYTGPINLNTNGPYTITYHATDLAGNTSTDTTANYTINIPPASNSPVMNVIADKTVYENQSLEFMILAYDPNFDPLTYTVTNLPAGATFNAALKKFIWTPNFDQAGVYIVTFTVSDGVLSDSKSVNITVLNTNRAPVLGSIGNQNVGVNNTLNIILNGTDPDGNPLIYTVSGLPAGATIIGNTFTWTPGPSDRGTYTAIFRVSDGVLTDSKIVTIKVDGAPLLGTITDQTVNENDTLSFTISGTDPDGDALTYSVTGLPSGAVFDPVSRTFTWKPTYDQYGVYPVTFNVSDGTLTTSKTINITVNNVPIYENIIKIVNNGTGRIYVDYRITVTEKNGTITKKTITGYINPGATLNSSFGSYPSGTKINIVENIYNKTTTTRTIKVDNYIYIDGAEFYHQNVTKNNVAAGGLVKI